MPNQVQWERQSKGRSKPVLSQSVLFHALSGVPGLGELLPPLAQEKGCFVMGWHCVDCGAKKKGRAGKRCRSCAAKKRCQNPDYIHRMSRGISLAHQRGAYSSPALRKKMSKAQKEAQNRPETRQRHSKAQRRRWARGDFDGVFTSDEYRKKLSESMKRAHQQGKFENIYTPESRRKQSLSMKRRWARGDFDELYTEEYRANSSRRMKELWRSGHFDTLFKSRTDIEKQVTAALDIMGIQHVSQYRPDGCTYIYDEFIEPNLLIEVHGDFWHKKPKKKERDRTKARWAKENGYHLIVFWGSEIERTGAWSLVAKHIVPLL
ncbi:MAG: PDDEXK family nuclease [Planctomycetota bacterium]